MFMHLKSLLKRVALFCIRVILSHTLPLIILFQILDISYLNSILKIEVEIQRKDKTHLSVLFCMNDLLPSFLFFQYYQSSDHMNYSKVETYDGWSIYYSLILWHLLSMLFQKRVYNRESIAPLNHEIQQMSSLPLLFYTIQIIDPSILNSRISKIMIKGRDFQPMVNST